MPTSIDGSEMKRGLETMRIDQAGDEQYFIYQFAQDLNVNPNEFVSAVKHVIGDDLEHGFKNSALTLSDFAIELGLDPYTFHKATRNVLDEFDDGDAPELYDAIKKQYGEKEVTMRFYWGTEDKIPHPSVTTVLGFDNNQAKKFRIEDWRKKHHDDRLRLKYHQTVGTWTHWEVLHSFGDLPQSHEEYEAKETLQRMGDINPEEGTPEYESYPDWLIKFDWNEIKKGGEWARQKAWELLENNPNGAYVETDFVEIFVHHPTVEDPDFGTIGTYAGQADLVYIDENGDRVMCDYKTSKDVHESYFSQVLAYKKSLEYHGYAVDRCEILQVDPVTKSFGLYEVPADSEDMAWKRFADNRKTVDELVDFPDEPTDIDL